MKDITENKYKNCYNHLTIKLLEIINIFDYSYYLFNTFFTKFIKN